ncbi:MAG: hypothetical protein JZU63_12920, partial [Rhodoferax sp.]|nr:hypothetical protein [Rhodoferax sp.]
IAWDDVYFDRELVDSVEEMASVDPNTAAVLQLVTTEDSFPIGILPGGQKLSRAQLAKIVRSRALPPPRLRPVSRSYLPPTGNGADGRPSPDCMIEGELEPPAALIIGGHTRWSNNHDDVMLELCIDDEVVDCTLVGSPAARTSGDDDLEVEIEVSRPYGHFQFAVPVRFCDGGLHYVEVREATTGELVGGAGFERRFYILRDGAWLIDGSKLEGWFVSEDSRPVDLEVWVDGVIADTIKVKAQAGQVAKFAWYISSKFIDGQTHAIQIRTTGFRDDLLPHAFGGTEGNFSLRIRHSIDSVNGAVIAGWAFDSLDPDKHLEVELHNGPALISRTITDINRTDVNSAHNITGIHGFEVVIPIQQFDGLPHAIQLRINGEELSLSRKWRLPPKLTRSLLQSSKNRYLGRVEQVTHSIVQGWALD